MVSLWDASWGVPLTRKWVSRCRSHFLATCLLIPFAALVLLLALIADVLLNVAYSTFTWSRTCWRFTFGYKNFIDTIWPKQFVKKELKRIDREANKIDSKANEKDESAIDESMDKLRTLTKETLGLNQYVPMQDPENGSIRDRKYTEQYTKVLANLNGKMAVFAWNKYQVIEKAYAKACTEKKLLSKEALKAWKPAALDLQAPLARQKSKQEEVIKFGQDLEVAQMLLSLVDQACNLFIGRRSNPVFTDDWQKVIDMIDKIKSLKGRMHHQATFVMHGAIGFLNAFVKDEAKEKPDYTFAQKLDYFKKYIEEKHFDKVRQALEAESANLSQPVNTQEAVADGSTESVSKSSSLTDQNANQHGVLTEDLRGDVQGVVGSPSISLC